VLALLFIPLERLFALRPEQPIFRAGWQTDLAHFAVSHLLVQVTVLVTLVPAAIFFRWAVHPAIQTAVAAQPLALQFVEIVVIADLSEYAIHRLFHAVPFLWRFHAVHHSSEVMDWLAGSRMHLVDVVVTRALAFVPLYVLGFSPALVPRGAHPRQRPVSLRAPGARGGHATLPPLAPRGRPRGRGPQLRRAPARDRPASGHLLHAV
jgi:sterol desaturase/sphingolipid hydroxylase (fatty acid hydroxylase superfamily)